ncbi:accessory gland protein Acp62F [Drosophila eugracilis]|uniref:accessory gland protein Acp62F n=1 Tax=Drosophila eugracilis TaxID=29029 RepID=UPI0007E64B2B|nr:accessory gland protein Acp62F [Drosophila eugracilis]
MIKLKSLCWLLLLLPALLMISVRATGIPEQTVINHEVDPDPGRVNYIWNPFPVLCGQNASMVRCAGVCPETCAFKSLKCPTYCGVNCKCKPEYVFNEKQELCILKTDCPQDVTQEVVETHRVFQ